MRWAKWWYILLTGRRIPITLSCAPYLVRQAKWKAFPSTDRYCDWLERVYRSSPPTEEEMACLSLLIQTYRGTHSQEEFVVLTHYLVASNIIMVLHRPRLGSSTIRLDKDGNVC